MKTLEIVELLGNVLECNTSADVLEEYMNEECKYDSDYSKTHIRSVRKIIDNLNLVAENVRNAENDSSYHCEIVDLGSILQEGVTLADLHGESFFSVYDSGILLYQFHSKDPVAVVYVKFNPGGQLTEIEFSRNKKWFNTKFYGDSEDSDRDIPYTVKPMTRNDRKYSMMN
jgi:hypothetical protein